MHTLNVFKHVFKREINLLPASSLMVILINLCFSPTKYFFFVRIFEEAKKEYKRKIISKRKLIILENLNFFEILSFVDLNNSPCSYQRYFLMFDRVLCKRVHCQNSQYFV